MLAIIGGSNAYQLLENGSISGERLRPVSSSYGDSQPIYRLDCEGREMLFMSRHGEQTYSISAPFVNYRANIYALKEMGARRVVAWSGPGAINPEYPVGSLVLPDDLIDDTRRRPSTFYEGAGWGFIRQNPVFCPCTRDAIAGVLAELDLPFSKNATYVCTEGPRLETPAEIRKHAASGADLVGMTLCPEAFLARELEMCYAPLCYVTNYAEGVKERRYQEGELFEGLSTPDENQAVQQTVNRFPEIIRRLGEMYDGISDTCSCGRSMLRYRKRGQIGDDWHDWVRKMD